MADYEWAQITLGQNDKIQEIAGQAGKASALLNANLTFVKTAVELGKVLLLAATNTQLILIIAVAQVNNDGLISIGGIGFIFISLYQFL